MCHPLHDFRVHGGGLFIPRERVPLPLLEHAHAGKHFIKDVFHDVLDAVREATCAAILAQKRNVKTFQSPVLFPSSNGSHVHPRFRVSRARVLSKNNNFQK
jgi:hypothetical protein